MPLFRTNDPDEVICKFDEQDDFGEEYYILPYGFWKWKRYYIVRDLADCAAGGINSGIFQYKLSEGFQTIEQAREALYSGNFDHVDF